MPFLLLPMVWDFANFRNRMIVLAVFALNIAHPGAVFAHTGKATSLGEQEAEAVRAVPEK